MSSKVMLRIIAIAINSKPKAVRLRPAQPYGFGKLF